jgi:hypothetical protein
MFQKMSGCLKCCSSTQSRTLGAMCFQTGDPQIFILYKKIRSGTGTENLDMSKIFVRDTGALVSYTNFVLPIRQQLRSHKGCTNKRLNLLISIFSNLNFLYSIKKLRGTTGAD